MNLEFDYVIPFSAAEAWRRQSELQFLIQTSKPILGMKPLAPAVERWQAGVTQSLKIKLFGFLPWSTHTIKMVKYDSEKFEFETRESGGAIKLWIHQHRLIPIDDHRCRGVDHITFEAGVMSPFVYAMSTWMYNVRHNAWNKLK